MKYVVLAGLLFCTLDLHAITTEENNAICKQNWGGRIQKVEKKIKNLEAFDKGHGYKKERAELLDKLNELRPELEEGWVYCVENGCENASTAFWRTIYKYNQLDLN